MNRMDKDTRLDVATQLLAGMLAGRAAALQTEGNDKQLVIRAVRMADLLGEACIKMPAEKFEEPNRPHLAVNPA